MGAMNYDPLAPSDTRHDPDAFLAEANKPISSSEEQSAAVWQIGKMDSVGARLERLSNESASDSNAARLQQPKLSPDELNRIYKNNPEPFKEPMYESTAGLIYNHKKNKQALEETVAAGPQGPMDKVGNFATGLFAHMTDPAELGIMALTGGLYESTALPGIVAQAAGRAAPLVAPVVRGALEMQGVEAVAGITANKEGSAYSFKDYLEGTVGGAVAFEGAKFGLGRAFRGASGFVRGFHEGLTTGHVAAEMEHAAFAQTLDGKAVDVEPIMRDLHNETSSDGGGKYVHTTVDTSKPMFTASESAVTNLNETVKLGDDLGEGIYLTDNPYSANGAAARKLTAHEGTLHEVKIPEDSNLLNLDAAPDAQVRAAMEESFGAKNVAGPLENEATIKMAMDKLQAADPEGFKRNIEAFNLKMEQSGYDGHVHDGSKFLGEDHPKQNHIMLFDKKNAEATAHMAPDRSDVPKWTPEQAKQVLDNERAPHRELFYDEKAVKEFEERAANAPEPAKIADLKKVDAETTAQLDANLEQGHIPEDMHTDIKEELRMKDAEGALMEKLMKVAANCGRRP